MQINAIGYFVIKRNDLEPGYAHIYDSYDYILDKTACIIKSMGPNYGSKKRAPSYTDSIQACARNIWGIHTMVILMAAFSITVL